MTDVLFMEKRVDSGLSDGGGEHDDEKPPPPSSSSSSKPPLVPSRKATKSSLPSRDALASMFKSTHLDTSPPRSSSSSSSLSQHHRHMPKVQSNLLKSTSPTRTTPGTKTSVAAINNNNRDELINWVEERERHLVSVKTEYEKHYGEYKQLVTKFYTEKLNNLKYSFKNQILKQKIYFETEMLELTREYWSDFEKHNQHQNQTSSFKSNSSPNGNKKSINKNKESKNKQLIKMLKDDLHTLVEYMRESLIQSSDTLIEAYETCECLKRLEKTEASVNRQYTIMSESTKNLLNKNSSSKTSSSSSSSSTTTSSEESDEEQARIDKYKSDLDELMNTLDDIELCHLQRKETLGGCCKLVTKLKSKFKFIESKYETLSRQVAALKFESYVYRELWSERLRSQQQQQQQQQQSTNNIRSASRSTSTSSLVDDCEINCQRDEFITSSCGASSSSSSSSMMSNHEQTDENFLLPLIDDFDLSDSNSSSSDDDASSDSAAPDLPNDNIRMGVNEANESKSPFSSSLPASDYNRKLALITDLINLHKSKSTTSSTSYTSSSSSSGSGGNDVWYNSQQETQQSQKQQSQKSSSSSSSTTGRQQSPTSNGRQAHHHRLLHHNNRRSSLGLVECSYEGDRVSVENCDLRRDCDLTGWLLERRIDGLDNLPVIETSLPANSVVRSGKALCILEPFGRQHNHIEEILTALKLVSHHSTTRLTITTRLLTPERILMASHTQDVPHFYREIFKYANLIHFVS